jgi:hypothetical protein
MFYSTGPRNEGIKSFKKVSTFNCYALSFGFVDFNSKQIFEEYQGRLNRKTALENKR